VRLGERGGYQLEVRAIGRICSPVRTSENECRMVDNLTPSKLLFSPPVCVCSAGDEPISKRMCRRSR